MIVPHSAAITFHTVDILNAPFYLLLLYPYNPRSHTNTLSCRLSFMDVFVYIRRPLLRKLGLKPDLVQS